MINHSTTLFLGVIATIILVEPVVKAGSVLNDSGLPTTESSAFENLADSAPCSLQYRFKNGQCTDWADARYYQLTCQHTQWWGDARLWTSKAQDINGWVVSDQPRVPSIIVIQPGIQGCGSPGHVAVVERIDSDGSVYTSNWNYQFNGIGGIYSTSYGNFRSGAGVQYIWHQ